MPSYGYFHMRILLDNKKALIYGLEENPQYI